MPIIFSRAFTYVLCLSIKKNYKYLNVLQIFNSYNFLLFFFFLTRSFSGKLLVPKCTQFPDRTILIFVRHFARFSALSLPTNALNDCIWAVYRLVCGQFTILRYILYRHTKLLSPEQLRHLDTQFEAHLFESI